MSIELKPCPFCGSRDISRNEILSKDSFGKMWHQDACLTCDASGPKVLRGLNDGSAWNRRTTNKEGEQ